MNLAKFFRRSLYVLVFVSAFIFTAHATAELWDIWDASDELNAEVIDHSQWQEVLTKYVEKDETGLNRFNYREAASDQNTLDTYLDNMLAIDPRTYAKVEQYAYWINLYNALTVDLILDNYPVDSITKVSEKLFQFGPWDDAIAELAGETLTLNDIEHRILRPIWADPRIHFAVNCASIGCPNLQDMAFTSANIESLLDTAAQDYLSHPRAASFNGLGFLVLSSIFDWYAEDFGAEDEEILQKLSEYAPTELAEELVNYSGFIFYEYDWDLNDIQ